MARSRRPNGFALPMTLFLIAILTLMLTAAFAKVQSDRRVGESSGANVSAIAVAKATLQQYLGATATRPLDGDSVRINVTGGYGDVIARVVRRPADTSANWIYIVRSAGHIIDPAQGADPQAVHTIAQFAQWQTGKIDVRAAYVSVNKVDDKKHGDDANTIDGRDLASCGAAARDTFGLLVANGSDNVADDINLLGSPSGQYEASWNSNAVADSTHIDWGTLIGGGFAADYASNGSIRTGDNSYPSQVVQGDATLNGSGTGLLIVTGDLTTPTNSNNSWKGIVLVGGTMTFGNQSADSIWGMVIVGLNHQLGTGVNGKQELFGFNNGSLYVRYDSCRIRQSLAPLTGFAPITNGWVDNWATY
jgi:type II secretory pathway pseudopilin PulG